VGVWGGPIRSAYVTGCAEEAGRDRWLAGVQWNSKVSSDNGVPRLRGGLTCLDCLFYCRQRAGRDSVLSGSSGLHAFPFVVPCTLRFGLAFTRLARVADVVDSS
jgi:hypothetical protein